MAESVLQITPSVLSPCSSGSSSSDSMSPEFEFWMVRNPTLPQPKLLSAAELFSDGALLPLHRLHRSLDDPTGPKHEKSCAQETTTGSDHNAEDSSGLAGLTIAASKSWKDIFKKSDSCKKREKEKEKGNKKEMKNDTAAGASSSSHRIRSAELNINIWPFSRSSSAGNGGSRPRMVTAAGTRKVSSAPCSRSNSTGDFKSRKWSASSPTQGGVHVSRNVNNPVWQVWRGGGVGGSGGRATDLVVENAEKGVQRKNDEVAGNSLSPA